MPKPLILVCNDDGIDAKGIYALACALDGLGEIVVIAPEREQSAGGETRLFPQYAKAECDVTKQCRHEPVSLSISIPAPGDGAVVKPAGEATTAGCADRLRQVPATRTSPSDRVAQTPREFLLEVAAQVLAVLDAQRQAQQQAPERDRRSVH